MGWPFSSRIFTPPPIPSPSLRDFKRVLDCGANAAETNAGTLIGDGAAAQLLDTWERNLLRIARHPPDIEGLSKRAAFSIILHSFVMPAGVPASNPAATTLA
jgi:hypothetical protein